MPFGIFVAIDEEFAGLKKRINNLKMEMIINRPFYTGKLEGKDVVLTRCHIGKVAAAIATTILIDHYKCSKIIFVGTAGAIDPKLRVGDFVVAESCVQHDCDSRPFVEPQVMPSLNIKYLECDKDLVSICEKAVQKFIADNPIDKKVKQDLHIPEVPQMMKGVLGSGDQFISTVEQRDKMLKYTPEMKAVAMEGAAIGQVCYDAKIPYAVIRLISDGANHDSECSFNKFCEFFAGETLYYLVVRLLALL